MNGVELRSVSRTASTFLLRFVATNAISVKTTATSTPESAADTASVVSLARNIISDCDLAPRGQSGAGVFRGCLVIASAGKSVTQSAHTTTWIVMRAHASLQRAPILYDHASNTSGVNDKIRTTVATRRHVRTGFGSNITFMKTKIATTPAIERLGGHSSTHGVQRIVSTTGGDTVRGVNAGLG